MKLVYDIELSKVSVFAQGSELAQFMGQDKDENGKRIYTHPNSKTQHIIDFENPVLVTDDYQISKVTPPSKRSTVHALFGTGIRETEYDGTTIFFEQSKYPGVWGPSIDTVLFTRALKKLDLSSMKTVIEVGAGSGFISKYLLDQNSQLQSISLVDLNRYAYHCWEENIKDSRAKFVIGDAFDYLEGKKADVILCNPPYIPRPKSIDDNPYEGVGLLKHLISLLDTVINENGHLIVNISSLCEEDVKYIFEDSSITVTKIDEMKVPLKVFNVINSKEWMEFLSNHGLEKLDREDYEFWQTITIYDITKKDKN